MLCPDDHSGSVISSVVGVVRGLEEQVDHAPVPVQHGLQPVDPLLEQHHGRGQLVHGHRHEEQRRYDDDESGQDRLQVLNMHQLSNLIRQLLSSDRWRYTCAIFSSRVGYAQKTTSLINDLKVIIIYFFVKHICLSVTFRAHMMNTSRASLRSL